MRKAREPVRRPRKPSWMGRKTSPAPSRGCTLRHPGRCARPAPLALSPHPFALSLSKGFDKLSPNGFTKPSAAQALTVASGIPCLWVRSPHPHPFALSPLSVRLELLSVRPELLSVRAEPLSVRAELLSACPEPPSVRPEPVEGLRQAQPERVYETQRRASLDGGFGHSVPVGTLATPPSVRPEPLVRSP